MNEEDKTKRAEEFLKSREYQRQLRRDNPSKVLERMQELKKKEA